MSEQRRVVPAQETAETPKTFLQKLLDGIERVGNKVPHPAVIFFILTALVVLLSHVFYCWRYRSITRWSIRRPTRSSMRPLPSTAC